MWEGKGWRKGSIQKTLGFLDGQHQEWFYSEMEHQRGAGFGEKIVSYVWRMFWGAHRILQQAAPKPVLNMYLEVGNSKNEVTL